MSTSRLSAGVAALMLASVLPPGTTAAQDADTLSISGTFGMDFLGDGVGADLADVYWRGNEHWWSLTLHGVTYSHDSTANVWNTEWGQGYYNTAATRVHATSFDFEFFGPDADELNAMVSQQLIRGGLTGDAFLELLNEDHFDPTYFAGGLYATLQLALAPLDAALGISFSTVSSMYGSFPTDVDGYPVLEPHREPAANIYINDRRPGNYGSLESHGDVVDIGSAGPPLPPPPPTLDILDGSVLEGNKGTSRLILSVTLSRTSSDVVTVSYRTVNGTALAARDYSVVAGGTLTIQPGQAGGAIAISVVRDRKREPNETFFVELTGAVGATIGDSLAVATILNDD